MKGKKVLNKLILALVTAAEITSTGALTTGCSTEKIPKKIEYSEDEASVEYNDGGMTIEFEEDIKPSYITGKTDEFCIFINNDTLPEYFEDYLQTATSIVINPQSFSTYTTMYNTIDFIKETAKEYDINIPILYNVDILSDKPKKNCILAKLFCDKLSSNGFYVGLYGKSTKLNEFEDKYAKYMSSKDLDMYDKLVVDDNKNEYTGNVYNMLYDDNTYSEDNYLKDVIINADLNEPDNYVEDREYTVKKGDDLTSIAERFSISEKSLKEYNNLENDNLEPGQTLILPNKYIKEVYNKKNCEIYTVVANDYLSTIASKYGMKLDDLLAANDLTTKTIIYPGDKIKIPKNKIDSLNKEKNSSNKTNTKTTDEEMVDEINSSYDSVIDISHYQWDNKPDVNFKKLKNSNIDHIMLKATDGLNEDPLFYENIKGCIENNISFGVYHFTRGTTKKELEKEAQYVSKVICERIKQAVEEINEERNEEDKIKLSDVPFDYPVAFDVETETNKTVEIKTSDNETIKTKREKLIKAAYDKTSDLHKYGKEYVKSLFNALEIIRENGFAPAIYANPDTCGGTKLFDEANKNSIINWMTEGYLYNKKGNATDESYKNDFLDYEVEEGEKFYKPTEEYQIIQYSSSSNISGIKGSVDFDIAISTLDEEIEADGYNQEIKWEGKKTHTLKLTKK